MSILSKTLSALWETLFGPFHQQQARTLSDGTKTHLIDVDKINRSLLEEAIAKELDKRTISSPLTAESLCNVRGTGSLTGIVVIYCDIGQITSFNGICYIQKLKEKHKEFLDRLPADVGVLYMSTRDGKSRVEFTALPTTLEKSSLTLLFAAAVEYYRALAHLETGTLNLEAIKLAETKMIGAEGSSLFTDADYLKTWHAFWQNARYTREKAEDLTTRTLASSCFKELWGEKCKILAIGIDALRDKAKTKSGIITKA